MLNRVLAITLTLLITPAAHAGVTGLGFGIHGGIVSGYDNPTLEQSVKDAFQSLTDFSLSKDMTNVGIHLKVGTLRVIDLNASLDYTWKSQNIYQDIDLTYSVVSGSASIEKSLSIGILSPYAGIGLGLYRSAYSMSNSDVIVVLPSDETNIGYHVKGGLELNFPIFPLTPFAEFRYNQVQTSDEPTKFYQLTAGLTFNLP
jgi:opacity protein-like surface antigen